VSAEDWRRWLIGHRGRIGGSVLGLLIAVAIMAWGILWTLFIGLAILVGFVVGRYVDGDQEGLSEWIDRLLPPGRR